MAFPTHYEPFGLVVTEAMACGLPVAVTPRCGAAPMVDADAGVVLRDGDDLDGLASAFSTWRDTPDARAAAGRAARRCAAAWTWAHMADAYEQLLLDQPQQQTSSAEATPRPDPEPA